jgi:inorganic pyrophosphatase
MHDEKGEDEKILAVPTGDPRFEEVEGLDDLPAHWLREIETFFATYKLLEDKFTELEGWDGRDAALRVIDEAYRRFEASLATAREE